MITLEEAFKIAKRYTVGCYIEKCIDYGDGWSFGYYDIGTGDTPYDDGLFVYKDGTVTSMTFMVFHFGKLGQGTEVDISEYNN